MKAELKGQMWLLLIIIDFWLLATVWLVLAKLYSEKGRAVVVAANQVAGTFCIVVAIALLFVARLSSGAAVPHKVFPCQIVAGNF